MRDLNDHNTPELIGSPRIGYARVSTDDQHLTNQKATLVQAGCSRIFCEKVTGTHARRAELIKLLDYARDGDVIVVTRLDRLARSTHDLLNITMQLDEKGVGLCSLAEPWLNTTSPAGKMIMTVFAGIAEFERSLIIERTAEGRARALQQGVKFGPKAKMTREKTEHAKRLVESGMPVPEVAKIFGVNRSTIYRVTK